MFSVLWISPVNKDDMSIKETEFVKIVTINDGNFGTN